ncbi:DUF1801 domain-containing protein [Alteromonadaceae bacterium BrNp21-10]|nr:DUF1801 domain-containing protein [Alteromonadaceae bacterium BrNp21-10]
MSLMIDQKVENYPQNAQALLLKIRSVIYQLADKQQLGEVTEQLKWGELSYSVKSGSPIRMDWKPQSPEQVAIYVHCGTSLVETYKELYPNELQYAGKRAIILTLNESVPWPIVEHCLTMALQYHRLKHLPLLGQ